MHISSPNSTVMCRVRNETIEHRMRKTATEISCATYLWLVFQRKRKNRILCLRAFYLAVDAQVILSLNMMATHYRQG